MKSQDAINLLTDLGDRFSSIHVVIPVPSTPTPQEVEDAVISIKNKGYSVYIETTAIGDQIVIMDKL